MSKLNSWKTTSFFCLLSAATAITSPAQVGCSTAAPCFESLLSFSGTDGQDPNHEVLVQGTDGDFYGTPIAPGAIAINCGTFCWGTVFKMTSGHTLTKP